MRCIGIGLLMFAAVAVAADDKKGVEITLDGLTSKTPADWEEVKTNKPFRKKEFNVPGPEGAKPAELVIFEGVGGGLDANIQRWKGQFKPPAGTTIDEATKIDKLEAGKVKMTYVDITGTYLFKTNPMAPKAEERPEHRMLMVAFEGPQDLYFVRLVGPEKTVSGQKKAFDEWLKNFK
jgi:hypothetical protein